MADDPKSLDRIVYPLLAVCAVLFLVDWFFPKHGPFEIEHIFGFYAICGLVGGIVFVLLAGVMRTMLSRPEDYYDE